MNKKNEKSKEKKENEAMTWSNYLQKDIDIPLQTLKSEGREISIIPHDALKDIILNKLPELGVKYDVTEVYVSPSHFVMRCTMSDNKGRRVQEIGESTADTLETPIAKGYPATMAFTRAFDRCAIAYLDLNGKVFADTEGVTGDSKENTRFDDAETVDMTTEYEDTAPPATIIDSEEEKEDKNKKSKKTKTKANAERDGAEDKVLATKASEIADTSSADAASEAAGAALSDTEAQSSAKTEVDISTPSTETSDVSPDGVADSSGDELETLGAIMINIGYSYRNSPVSIAQLFETNMSYMKWVAGKYTAHTEETKKEKSACQRYLELKGEKYE